MGKAAATQPPRAVELPHAMKGHRIALHFDVLDADSPPRCSVSTRSSQVQAIVEGDRWRFQVHGAAVVSAF
jgi:hypothetical protein